MNTSKSKPLAKVFGPVLLLSAALALPVDSYAAPSPRERSAQSERADRNERKAKRAEKRNHKQEFDANRARNQRRQSAEVRNRGQEQRAEARRQAELNRQRAAERQRAQEVRKQSQRQAQLQKKAEQSRRVELQRQRERRAEVQRQANLRQQFERTQRANRLQESREAELQRQRQAELNRRAELQRRADRDRHWQAELHRRAQLQRQAELNRRAELQRRADRQRYAVPRGRYNDGRYYDDRYRSYAGQDRWNRGDSIVVDGHLTNEGYRCQALRDDNGDLYMLVGNTYGLRTGDHARVVGRVVDGGHCDWEGTAFEITDVKALWADRRHRSTYYHHNYDGERFGHRNNWTGRRPRAFENRIERYGYYDSDRNRYDDRYRDDYDDDRYGRNGNRQLIIREGRVYNDRGCTVLDTGNDQFGLTGNLRGLRNGDDVKVTGFLEGPSRCAGKTIRVGEVSGR